MTPPDYKRETGANLDEFSDAVATECGSNHVVAIGKLSACKELAVPGQLIT
jgi:hypothetical protein